MKRYRALLPVLLFIWVAGSFFVPKSFAQNEEDLFVLEKAQAIFDQMTPEERVGQLFLVYYEGSQLDQESEIVNLILEAHIGGVVLDSRNNNFSNSASPTADLARTINGMQELALVGRSSRLIEEVETEELESELEIEDDIDRSLHSPLPLFVAVSNNKNHQSQIVPGFTQLPSQLALGATWDPDMAEMTGQIMGEELGLLGVNLLLALSLNVVELPGLLQSVHSEGLIDSFSGDAYWVGEFGRSFVQGVKAGSGQRVAVIGGDFPGSGKSDRPLNSEVATVRTSLIDLQNGDLAPFLSVADSTVFTDTIDGFMTAHLRYQGFQGNIDERSAPLSFDAQAIEILLQLEPLADWRLNGGMLVSGELGASAIRRYYASQEDPYPHRRVARDSLLAGNDLLYAGYFAAEDNVGLATDNVRDTLAWFSEQYATDSTFRSRVDEAVLRILQTKVRLYGGDFTLTNVLIDEVSIEGLVGQQSSQVDMIALEAISQLAPRPSENPEPLPRTPSREDTIVIFTDSRPLNYCPSCDQIDQPSIEALEARIIQLYGPNASNQVEAEQILSFSFGELTTYLNAERPILAPTPAPVTTTETISVPVIYPDEFLVQDALSRADWIVFATQGVREDIPSSSAMNRLFTERPEEISDRIVTVFSLGYPIDLDSTDISRVTAYYGLFSVGDAFIDGAARVLFRELSLRGASPISIDSIRYDLNQITLAQPSQVIDLSIESYEEGENGLPPEILPGDTLLLRTGVILDYNGHPVPDGTLVEFTQEDRVQGFYSVIAEVFTVDGQASFDYVVEDRAGQFRLRASSGDAVTSAEVDIVILENDTTTIEVRTPTPAPTATPTQTPIPTATTTPTPTPTESPTQTPVPVVIEEEPTLDISLSEIQTLGSLVLGLFGVGWLGNLTRSESHPLSGRIRKVLWGLLFSLVGYIWFFTGMPGSEFLPDWGVWRWMFVTVACGIPGIGLAWLFNQVFESE